MTKELPEKSPITIEQLRLITRFVNLQTEMAEREYPDKKYDELFKESRAISDYFEDCACSHDFYSMGEKLKRCRTCHATRFKEAA